ncbi:MAG: 1-acyl-sn-glycerol-3-phosphate acyltransferase [Candidatus Jettenia ecosi]|uniref:1-acyl-sn-glycerol-3-phosphate acyltransferase n=1 Tax=Candidatus Jettenia ecosi TaxID=2494326 RepID=A0A533QD41_9BACT|nr:MAG: 1-acyl-sn-glycerol-3-phosphate acyltransferase [Candidatus Jettenia ecosi]
MKSYNSGCREECSCFLPSFKFIQNILHYQENMSQDLTYIMSRTIIRIYTRLMLRMDVSWKTSLPSGPKLIVANHPSCSDPIYLASIFPHPVNILITNKPFLIPMIGSFLRWLGQVPVPPGKGLVAFESARQLLKAGCSVALFPEGCVSPQEGGIHPLRTGAARLALLTGVPVVPIGIYLNRERNHAIASNVAGKRTIGYWCLRGVYSITVGPAVNYEGSVEHKPNVAAVSDRIMQQITQLSLESEQRAKGSNQFSIDGTKQAGVCKNNLKIGSNIIRLSENR